MSLTLAQFEGPPHVMQVTLVVIINIISSSSSIAILVYERSMENETLMGKGGQTN